ncbi:MAG: hypothetical protein ACK56I_28205 [bacterium]
MCTCSWCLPSGGALRDPLPHTARSYRNDTHTRAHFPASTQVRCCRYSRLLPSEFRKLFLYVT